MEEIYRNSFLFIHSLTQLCDTCYKYYEDPVDDNGEEIIKIINKCEEKFLKVKEEIVKMIRKVEIRTQSEEHKEISTTQTEGGFLINKE